MTYTVEGEPQTIRAVARHFGDLSSSARYARTQLAALQRGELQSCWSGIAADAFASELERLPADLGKLEGSLDKASTAVKMWANTVEQFQQQAQVYQRDLDSATSARSAARAARDDEVRAIAADPIDSAIDALSGNNRLAPYQERVDDAKARVRRVENQIDQVREEVESAARRVAYLLDEASRLGLQNKGFFEKLGDFLSALREVLIEILAFLDELVDLIAPWVGMALFILSFVNPAFAVAALAFALLDFSLTAQRVALGDDRVGAKDLFDDAIDVGLAVIGAKGAGAGIKGFKALQGAKAAKAGAQGSKLVKGFDFAADVVGGGKVFGDYYLNVADMAGVGPGSTFDLVFDVATGNTDSWAPGAGDPYGSDFIEAGTGLIDATGDAFDAGLDLIGIDVGDGGGYGSDLELPPPPEPPPGPGPEPGPGPTPEPGPGPTPEPGPGPTPEPGPGPTPEPGPGPTPEPGPDITPPPPDGGPGVTPRPDPGPGITPLPSDGGAGGGFTPAGHSGGFPPADVPPVASDTGLGSFEDNIAGSPIPSTNLPSADTTPNVQTPSHETLSAGAPGTESTGQIPASSSSAEPVQPVQPAPIHPASAPSVPASGATISTGLVADTTAEGSMNLGVAAAATGAAAAGLGAVVAGAKRLTTSEGDTTDSDGNDGDAGGGRAAETAVFDLDAEETP